MVFSSSPLLRLGAFVIRCALWLAATLWIVVLLVWGALHFVIVPRIADFRPQVEVQASRMLGLPVRIGSIVVRSNGLIPSLELGSVDVLDAQGREALKLPSVVAALSAPSILRMGLEQLIIESPELDIRRSPDGRLWIAGLPVAAQASTDTSGADWIFSQPELVIRHGKVTWTDELRGVPTLALTDVDWVLRNSHRQHAMRLDATPPEHWGKRVSLMGKFKEPLLARHASRWQDWDGQLYANFDHVDVAQLHRYAEVGVELTRGAGSLRVWVDVLRGAPTAATADLALDDVELTAHSRLQTLGLRAITGRLGVKRLPGGMEFLATALQFQTHDGLKWPGGNMRLAQFDATASKPERGELGADRMDLAALAQIAQRLPLDAALRNTIAQLDPRGGIEQLQAHWELPTAHPPRFGAKGRIAQLDIASLPHPGHLGRPGFTGASVEFDLTEKGGRGSVTMQAGSLDFPGVFDEPTIPMDQLSGDVQWKTEGEQIQVTVSKLRFANADAQGEAQAKWMTGAGRDAARFPGILDLQGSLSRANGARVYRYLPTVLDKEVRHYVQTAVPSASASNVQFKVKGGLHDFPFASSKQGDFRISADIKNAFYAYVPPTVSDKPSPQWPALAQLSGEFIIDRALLQIKGARANVAGTSGLRLTRAEANIDNLYNGAVVTVNADAQGPLAEMLGTVVNESPLGPLMDHALQHATVGGVADYRFRLTVPIATPQRSTVRGTITLGGNDIQVRPDTPALTRARGTIAFTESGFSVAALQAQGLGGEVQIDGGLNTQSVGASKAANAQVLRLQGRASADGLRIAHELGFVARLAHYASGTAAYSATVGLRGSVPEINVSSDLQGMAFSLPAPLDKAANTNLPLRLDISAQAASLVPGADGAVRAQDLLQLSLGKVLSLQYVRDVSGQDARALRGAIGVGLADDETAPLPAEGVQANIQLSQANLDAWSDVLARLSTDAAAVPPSTAASTAAMSYLPTRLALRGQEITLTGRKLHNVVLGGSREGLVWRANLDSAQANGYVEYRQPSDGTAGRVTSRLSRLVVAPGTAQDVENVLDQQPTSIPALDIVVEDLELRGKKLGRIEIDAVNLGGNAAQMVRDVPREWRLNRFNIITPEATLSATGNWVPITPVPGQPNLGATRSIKERRRTTMQFKLDITDAGKMLQRFDMPGVILKGQGAVTGQVQWQGSPITLDYPSLGGAFQINVENGQFLKTDPGLAKLLGVLSLQSLPRRLMLDFRDVFAEGFAFDFLRGDVSIAQGIASTSNLQMKGVAAVALMEGQADIAKETQNIRVVVVPEINAGSASLLASYINPVWGLGSFLAQFILRRPLLDAITKEFVVDGTWVNPHVTEVDHKPKPASTPAPQPQGAATAEN